MKTKSIIYIFFLGAMVLSGCKKFLETIPKATISDEKLFQDETGFEQALNGVYSELGEKSLYGDNLTMGYLSALAKNYNISNASHIFYLTNSFNYDNSSYISSIWSQAYNSIATLNNILSHIDEKKGVFSANNYNILKGEVLGLRAYIHFDLMRLFGQNYQTNPEAIAVPYRKDFSIQVEPAVTNKEIVVAALEDLDIAEELLSVDPIKESDLFRRYHFNYYAVLALKARIYDYAGYTDLAKTYAQEVIDGAKFPFIKEENLATVNAGQKDRLFTTEIIWALRVKDMKNWTEGATSTANYFRYSSMGALNFTLTLPEASYRNLFEFSVNPLDYRYQYLYETDETTSGSGKFPSKYWQTWSQSTGQTSQDRLDQTVPLIRIAEMYYILANNSASIEEALGYLNTVRQNRGISLALNVTNISDEDLLLREITKEYQKEFYAEGQTFFWYKQIGTANIPLYGEVVKPENYVFPIPDTELEYNPSY